MLIRLPLFFTLIFILLCISLGYLQLGSANLYSLFQQNQNDMIKIIFYEVRLPRLLLAILVGAALGATGAMMQGYFRNPLASPDLLGISNCAALGAVVMFYFGWAHLAWYMLPLGGFIGATIGVLLIFVLSFDNRYVLNMLLIGVAINAIMASLISLVLNFSSNPYAMSEIVNWLLGSLTNRSMQDVWMVMPFVITGLIICFSLGRYLQALSLGEETAQTLGFNPKRSRAKLVLALALCMGPVVAATGSIGFVGLVVPHIIRPWVKNDSRQLLWSSALAGAILVVLADALVQLISTSQELKIGVITAMLGGPFFLYCIYTLRSGES